GREPTLQSADDASRKRLVEAERIADGERRLSNFEISRAADRDRWRHSPHAHQADNRKILVRRHPDDVCPHRLPRSKPHRRRIRNVVQFTIGDDVASMSPDQASPGLNLCLLAARGRNLGTAANDLHYRGRHALEKRDGGPFKVGEIAPWLDRPGGGRREKLIV